jgi:hypothetical protein
MHCSTTLEDTACDFRASKAALLLEREKLSLIYFSRCEPLYRSDFGGVSGRNKGSAGRKIFFCASVKLSCAIIPKLLERN